VLPRKDLQSHEPPIAKLVLGQHAGHRMLDDLFRFEVRPGRFEEKKEKRKKKRTLAGFFSIITLYGVSFSPPGYIVCFL
jgi:hypothetical protein